MSAHFERGRLLFDQSRYDQAIGELTAHLAESPDDDVAHVFAAISLAHLHRFDDALGHAREAIRLDPESGLSYFALAQVELERNRYEAAAAALEEAIRCAPTAASFHGLMAAIRSRQKRWPEALAAAEQGLEFDPEDLQCLNMRALAQRQLGQNEAASETMRDALARDPNDAMAHANQGWAFLETGEAEAAITQFREALRLEPDLEFARLGILEALKARNFVYRAILRYLLWSGKHAISMQWAIALGVLFVLRFIDSVGRSIPVLAPATGLIVTLLIVAAISTFFAQPLFNFVLLFHPLGRLAMTRDQKAQGALTAVLVTAYAVFLIWTQVTARVGWHDDAFLALAALSIPALSIHDCQRGWPRWTAIGLMLAAPIAFFLPMLLSALFPPITTWMRGMGGTFYALLLVVGLISLCNWLEEIELVE